MNFIIKTTLKLLLFFFLLVLPIGLFITFLALSMRGVPLWNLGLRNIVDYGFNYLPHTVVVSYVLAALITVSLVDRIKVKSLFAVHVPVIIAGIITGAGLYYMQEAPVYADTELNVGKNTFFKNDVFSSADGLSIMTRGANTYHVYDRKTNTLSTFASRREAASSLKADLDRGTFLLYGPDGPLTVPLPSGRRNETLVTMGLVVRYAERARLVYRRIHASSEGLGRNEKLMLAAALVLSTLMILIPLAWTLNDSGWRCAGLFGVFFFLGLAPYFTGFLITMLKRFEPNLSFMGAWKFLFPAVVFGGVGIVIDVIAGLAKKAGR